jgi:hypothetical protein
MSKRIVRLSESQLRDMIKKVVSEQTAPMAKPAQQSVTNDPDYKTAWGVMNQLMTAIQGIGTDEDAILKAIQFVKTQRIYNYLLQIVQKSPTVKQKTGSNYKLVMDYILTDFQTPIVDQPMWTSRNFDRNTSVWDKDSGISLDKDSQITSRVGAILQKFNFDEGRAWFDAASEDKPV